MIRIRIEDADDKQGVNNGLPMTVDAEGFVLIVATQERKNVRVIRHRIWSHEIETALQSDVMLQRCATDMLLNKYGHLKEDDE